MKKFLIILIPVVVLAVAVIWYFTTQNKTAVPVANESGFGAPFGPAPSDESPIIPINNEEITSVGGREFLTLDQNMSTSSLFRISQSPVAGVIVLDGDEGTHVRYAERATGHIYDVNLETLERTRVTNQTLPKIYEARFRSDGTAIIFRTLKDDSDTAENLSLSLTPSQEAGELYTISSLALRSDIGAITTGSGDRLFYLLKDSGAIVSSNFQGEGIKTLFTSSFTDWNLGLINGNKSLVLSTKASARASGYAYTLSVSGGSPAKILGPLNGLVVNPSPTANDILYSYTDGNRARLFVKNVSAESETSEIMPATLADKCAWGRKDVSRIFCGVPDEILGNNEPDLWYAGLSNFSDRLWLFDRESKSARLLTEPTELFGLDIDVFLPRLSANDDFLTFMNRNDFSLWALRLEEL